MIHSIAHSSIRHKGRTLVHHLKRASQFPPSPQKRAKAQFTRVFWGLSPLRLATGPRYSAISSLAKLSPVRRDWIRRGSENSGRGYHLAWARNASSWRRASGRASFRRDSPESPCAASAARFVAAHYPASRNALSATQAHCGLSANYRLSSPLLAFWGLSPGPLFPAKFHNSISLPEMSPQGERVLPQRI